MRILKILDSEENTISRTEPESHRTPGCEESGTGRAALAGQQTVPPPPRESAHFSLSRESHSG